MANVNEAVAAAPAMIAVLDLRLMRQAGPAAARSTFRHPEVAALFLARPSKDERSPFEARPKRGSRLRVTEQTSKPTNRDADHKPAAASVLPTCGQDA